MKDRASDYRAYLLRLWHTREDGGCWRASLEDAGTREVHVFAGMHALMSYLTAVTDALVLQDMPEGDEGEGGSGECTAVEVSPDCSA